MNRQEAYEFIKGYLDNVFHQSNDYDTYSHLRDCADTLAPPEPDPGTGLLPCGCGGKPELRDEGRGWYQVYCTGCDMHGGNSHTPDGVIEEWNTAMGYTAPPRPGAIGPDAGKMDPNGDEGAKE